MKRLHGREHEVSRHPTDRRGSEGLEGAVVLATEKRVPA